MKRMACGAILILMAGAIFVAVRSDVDAPRGTEQRGIRNSEVTETRVVKPKMLPASPAQQAQLTVSDSESPFIADDVAGEYAMAHQLLIDRYGVEEADFRVALGENVGDWETLKSMVLVRDQATGQNHSRILFDVGMATGALTREELISMLEQGAVTADEAFEQSVFYANTDMLDALLDLGLSIDFAAAHPVTGEDAVGTFVRRLGWQPTETDLPTALTTIERLVQMGANPTVGLNAALRGVNPSNASNSFEIASALRAQGGVADPSIRQHIERLRDDDFRRKLLELFE
ncbi:MAG: hypothetical protein AAFN07_04070 [Pseudomonadota bacterium]